MDESDGLENRCGRKVTVGSNPTSSAQKIHFRVNRQNAGLMKMVGSGLGCLTGPRA